MLGAVRAADFGARFFGVRFAGIRVLRGERDVRAMIR
jgi:hypothetical protein